LTAKVSHLLDLQPCRPLPGTLSSDNGARFPSQTAYFGGPMILARRKFLRLGAGAVAGSTAEFAKLIATDAEKWMKVIRAANIEV